MQLVRDTKITEITSFTKIEVTLWSEFLLSKNIIHNKIFEYPIYVREWRRNSDVYIDISNKNMGIIYLLKNDVYTPFSEFLIDKMMNLNIR